MSRIWVMVDGALFLRVVIYICIMVWREGERSLCGYYPQTWMLTKSAFLELLRRRVPRHINPGLRHLLRKGGRHTPIIVHNRVLVHGQTINRSRVIIMSLTIRQLLSLRFTVNLRVIGNNMTQVRPPPHQESENHCVNCDRQANRPDLVGAGIALQALISMKDLRSAAHDSFFASRA